MTRTRKPQPAFSLIELLIVIAIIATLVAILFPLMASIQETAKRTRCIRNLKHLGTATFAYVADHDNCLPLGLYRAPGLSLPWSRNLVGLPGRNYLFPEVYPASTAQKATGKTVFDCPSRSSPALYDKLHYGYSDFPGMSIYDYDGVGLTRRLSEIKRPSQTMLFGEIPPGYRLITYRADLLEFPHQGNMNAFYADGSVQMITHPVKNANTSSEEPQPPFF